MIGHEHCDGVVGFATGCKGTSVVCQLHCWHFAVFMSREY